MGNPVGAHIEPMGEGLGGYDIRRWRMAPLVLRQTGNRNLDEVKADALSVTI